MSLLTQGQHLPILNRAVIRSKIGARKLKIKIPLNVKRAFWKKQNVQSLRSAAYGQYLLSNTPSPIEKPLRTRDTVENEMIDGTLSLVHALVLPYCRCCHCVTIVAMKCSLFLIHTGTSVCENEDTIVVRPSCFFFEVRETSFFFSCKCWFIFDNNAFWYGNVERRASLSYQGLLVCLTRFHNIQAIVLQVSWNNSMTIVWNEVGKSHKTWNNLCRPHYHCQVCKYFA